MFQFPTRNPVTGKPFLTWPPALPNVRKHGKTAAGVKGAHAVEAPSPPRRPLRAPHLQPDFGGVQREGGYVSHAGRHPSREDLDRHGRGHVWRCVSHHPDSTGTLARGERGFRPKGGSSAWLLTPARPGSRPVLSDFWSVGAAGRGLQRARWQVAGSMQRRLPALPPVPAGHAVPSASADDLYRRRSRSGLSRSRSLGNGRACPGAPGPSHLPILARHLGSRGLRSTLDALGRAHSSAHPEPGKLGISPGF